MSPLTHIVLCTDLEVNSKKGNWSSGVRYSWCSAQIFKEMKDGKKGVLRGAAANTMMTSINLDDLPVRQLEL